MESLKQLSEEAHSLGFLCVCTSSFTWSSRGVSLTPVVVPVGDTCSWSLTWNSRGISLTFVVVPVGDLLPGAVTGPGPGNAVG